MHPFNLRIGGKKILFVGGGRVATRKILSILPCKPKITVIAPEATSELQKLADSNCIDWLKRNIEKDDIIKEYLIIFCYTDNKDINDMVANLAQEQNILINVANNVELSTVHMPAVYKCDDVTIAVNTGNPKRSQDIRDKIKKYIESENK